MPVKNINHNEKKCKFKIKLKDMCEVQNYLRTKRTPMFLPSKLVGKETLK